MPVVDIWRRRASSCGRVDGSDQVNDARIKGAQVRRQAVGGERGEQIVRRLLTGRGKELSLPRFGLAEEESSRSADRGGATVEGQRKRRAASGSVAGI